MKKLVAVLLSCSILLVACSNSYDVEESITDTQVELEVSESTEVSETVQTESIETEETQNIEELIDCIESYEQDDFTSLADPALHQYVEDEIYEDLESSLGEDYQVLNVNAIYVSQEYLEELEYNSQKNIYFGYTIDEIESQYGDVPYIFTLGDDGTTIVQIVEPSADNYNEIVRNVAIGTGVILICVTVAVVSDGTLAGPSAAAGASVINTIFVSSATSAAKFAVGGAVISGAAQGIITGLQTGDYQDGIDAGLLAASEGFMWGAITGAVAGGVQAAVFPNGGVVAPEETPNWIGVGSETGIPTPRQSELNIQNALGLSDDVAQVSYLNGEVVPYGTAGSTRPDLLLTNPDGTLTAVEIKNYDLVNDFRGLVSTLQEQLARRAVNLPEGTAQQLYLDVTGRGYSPELIEMVETVLSEALSEFNIEMIFFGL